MPGLGARLPLNTSLEDGPYELLQDIKQVAAQNIKMLIFTNPGERIMDINFGVGIKRYLFRQNTQITYNTLKGRIREQLATYLPYVKIEKLYINSPLNNPNLPENFMGLRIEYKIVPFNERDVLELSVSS
mgnify:FL=1|tara:strand:+ start:90 stop:479 length:390 start_codon:yes stop_codon:yes gene_type:complete